MRRHGHGQIPGNGPGGVIHGFVDLTQQDDINILTASF